MHQETVCITGGTGFVGQHLSNRLTKQGYKVRILTRRRERYRNLLVNPGISLIETDVHNIDELRRQFQGVDVIINLVGILNETGKKGAGFRRVHVELPEKIVFAAELVSYTRDQLQLKTSIIGLNDSLSRLQARILGLLPGKPFTLDNYYSLQHDSVCTDNALPSLGITPTPVAAVVPACLSGKNARGHYPAFRRQSRRT